MERIEDNKSKKIRKWKEKRNECKQNLRYVKKGQITKVVEEFYEDNEQTLIVFIYVNIFLFKHSNVPKICILCTLCQ